MARTKKFFHAVWSGYALTILLSVLNLATIPIVLSALGKDQFGIWSAVTQIAAFTLILDMGLGPSLARFLTDFKDDQKNPAYAQFLKSVFFISFVQCLLFCTLTSVLFPYLPELMGIPADHTLIFKTLLFWQLGTTALGFFCRPFTQLLYAHQCIAQVNGCSLLSSGVNAAVLVVGLKSGFGIYVCVFASWAAFLAMQSGIFFFIFRLKLLPNLREARVSLTALKPLARFSSDVFLIVIGLQVVNFAPTLLVTRHLGISALTDWTIGTRLVYFASQLTNRIPGASEPAFWEMFSRREFSQLRQRWLEVLQLAGSFAVLLGAGVAAINPPFIHVWTGSQVYWETRSDVLLGLWIMWFALASCLNMTPGITKHVAGLRFVYLLEGASLLIMAYMPGIHLKAHWQVALILLLCLGIFRLPYGLFRTCRDLGIPFAELSKTLGRILGIALLLLSLAVGLHLAAAPLSDSVQLAINMIVFGSAAIPAIYLVTLPPHLQKRIQSEISRRLKLTTLTPLPPNKDERNEQQ